MAKQDISKEDIISIEESLREIIHRLWKLRESMEDNCDEVISVNIGTLIHAIGEADAYSVKLENAYAQVSRQNKLRAKLKASKKRKAN